LAFAQKARMCGGAASARIVRAPIYKWLNDRFDTPTADIAEGLALTRNWLKDAFEARAKRPPATLAGIEGGNSSKADAGDPTLIELVELATA
jgi:hypothetical protein